MKADTCGIKKNLAIHIARHTFESTVILRKKVNSETISKMLGHANLRITRHYAKMLDLKISEEILALKKKLEGKIVLLSLLLNFSHHY